MAKAAFASEDLNINSSINRYLWQLSGVGNKLIEEEEIKSIDNGMLLAFYSP